METTELLLIRHAESTWNAARRWQGQGDPPLSARGRRQAARLARDLVHESIDLLVSSDLARALQTARALGEAIGLGVRRESAWRELDVGAWTGLTRAEIERSDGPQLARFGSGDPDARAGGAECRREVEQRARRAATELAIGSPGLRVAVVTHLGVIRALLDREPSNAECCRARVGGDGEVRELL